MSPRVGLLVAGALAQSSRLERDGVATLPGRTQISQHMWCSPPRARTSSAFSGRTIASNSLLRDAPGSWIRRCSSAIDSRFSRAPGSIARRPGSPGRATSRTRAGHRRRRCRALRSPVHRAAARWCALGSRSIGHQQPGSHVRQLAGRPRADPRVRQCAPAAIRRQRLVHWRLPASARGHDHRRTRGWSSRPRLRIHGCRAPEVERRRGGVLGHGPHTQ